MSDFLTYLEQDLVEAARRRSALSPSRRRPLRSLALALALALVIGGTATAATLLVLRGSVIPAPNERDAGPGQTAAPGSAKVLPLRAANPGGGPAWALRVAKSKTGLSCTTVGQEVGGEFGLVGLDGRFRKLADGVVDACGAASTTLVGARVFDAPRPGDVRTVVNGVAGPQLRAVTITSATGNRRIRPGAGGTFLYVQRGYPEANAVGVRLRFADGHVESHALGVGNGTSVGAGEAWRPFPFVDGSEPDKRCLSFDSVRPPIAQSPAACTSRAELRKPAGYFVAIRRIDASSRRWAGHAPVTAVWGDATRGVKRVEVITPRQTIRARIVPHQLVFVVVLPGYVDPASVKVRVTLRDGRVLTHTRDANTVPPPKGWG